MASVDYIEGYEFDEAHLGEVPAAGEEMDTAMRCWDCGQSLADDSGNECLECGSVFCDEDAAEEFGGGCYTCCRFCRELDREWPV